MRPLLFALMLLMLIMATALSTGCGSSGVTNTTGPTPTHCQVSVTNSTSSFGVSGGDGSVAVNVARECSWSAASQAGWIAITSAKTGQGDGSVTYHVAANADPVSRRSSITIGDQQASIAQDAAPCEYAVSGLTDPLAASSGNSTITVQTNGGGCSWTATSDQSWVTLNPQSGSGTASIGVSASDNVGPQRTATITLAATRLTLTQLGAPSIPTSPTPPSTPPPTPPPTPTPTPTPTPAPTPPPPPTPGPPPPPPPPDPTPPPPPTAIDLSGKVSSVHGTCPSLTFNLKNYLVRTSASTEFAGKPCKKLESGTNVSVHGTVESDGSVAASKVTVAGEGDGG